MDTEPSPTLHNVIVAATALFNYGWMRPKLRDIARFLFLLTGANNGLVWPDFKIRTPDLDLISAEMIPCGGMATGCHACNFRRHRVPSILIHDATPSGGLCARTIHGVLTLYPTLRLCLRSPPRPPRLQNSASDLNFGFHAAQVRFPDHQVEIQDFEQEQTEGAKWRD